LARIIRHMCHNPHQNSKQNSLPKNPRKADSTVLF
jgi:hypothetical protein